MKTATLLHDCTELKSSNDGSWWRHATALQFRCLMEYKMIKDWLRILEETDMDLLQIISDRLWNDDLVLTRIAIATASLVTGSLFLWNHYEFFPSGLAVDGHFIYSEDIWGLALIIAGILQYYSVYSNSYNSMCARLVTMTHGVMWPITMLAAYLKSYCVSPTSGASVVIAILAIWLWIRPILFVRGTSHARGFANGRSIREGQAIGS